ncbi:preprotein translocase subunit YajC [Lactobacillus johnsonii]|uniref:Preprotein translocase subunit YajC n=1 Tax=Lactobacillus johnsonii TaxID=33959 RepID=A0A267M6T3_LACJH|nr:preprotein translocase subunit YajC [Lactobacillus johnsonii]OUP15202.1 preprotein translocase subunit YajC [Lactobacillus johnsonii]PAB55299.1 preprotein translocase subunit YajC [Lactobacillus johnsonii]
MRCNTLNTFFLAQSSAGMNNIFMIIAMIAIFVFFYFSMIKPQKKQQQERMKMMSELKKGDQVIMVDGLHGKVDSINDSDKTVVIDADGIFLTFERMAIRRVLPTAAAPTQDLKSNEAKEEKVETEEKTVEKDSKPEEKATDTTENTKSEDK